jgi:hypothetical protein
MAVIKPVMYTPIEDAEVSEGNPVSDETVRKLVQNSNMLGALACIGSIRAIAVNVVGVPAPSVDQFQYCDGSEITHPQSPLQSTSGFTRLTPDTRQRYIRGATSESSNGLTALNPTNNLSHTHTTGFVAPVLVGYIAEECKGWEVPHNHTVNADLSATDPIDPAHFQIALYLKIN